MHLKIMFKTAVITGSNGWIGSTLESYLKHTYKEVIICKADRELQLLEKIAGEVALFHFAFPTKDRVANFSLEEYRNSVLYLRQNVINLINKIKPTKMVYLSSGAVYKLGTNNFISNLEEDAYGLLKLEEEQIFTQIAKKKGIKLIIPRVFALVGGFINKPQNYLIADFILQAVKTGKIQIKAQSRVFRSYINIYDLFEICFKFFQSSINEPIIFDTQGDEILELNDIAFYIAQSLNLNIEVNRAFDFKQKENRYYTQNNSYSKMIQALNITKFTSLHASILNTKSYLLS